MEPPTVSVLALTVTAGLPVRVTAPVPRFRLEEPVNEKLVAQVCALLLGRVKAEPVMLSNTSVGELKVSVPVPTAFWLLMFSKPPVRVNPLMVFAPDRVSVPAPLLVRVKAPTMGSATMVLLMALTVLTVAFPYRVTPPFALLSVMPMLSRKVPPLPRMIWSGMADAGFPGTAF